jgi:response regulator RpfG family c-di-GMP phosphodiesterase
VDDESLVRDICKSFLRREDVECHEASDGEEGLRLLSASDFDLVLLDIDMPRLTGTETLRRLRQNPPSNNLKVIMMSGGITSDEMSELLAMGADDYITKPLGRPQLLARIKAALLHKATQDRSELLNQQLLAMNSALEQTLLARNGDLVQARNALVFTLAKIVESRSNETTGHLTRLTQYAAALARQASQSPRFASVLDQPFLKTLEACTSLHDIGNVALPDHILRAAAPLDREDFIIQQSHTTIGADTLQSVAKRDRSAAAFWQMAIDVARHHHERYDGTGYPDRLAHNDIPMSARIVAIADAYDELRAQAPRGAALAHDGAVKVILEGSPGRFDPHLLQAFADCGSEFERIHREHPDEQHPA